jgi:DNA repair protein RadD
LAFGIISPGYPETEAPVQVASVASLARPKRLGRWRGKFNFIVVDEAHHAVAGSWATALASQLNAHVLGVTATPERLDGRGLREQFDDLVIGPSTAWLTEGGWLSRFTFFEPIAGGPDMSGARIRAGDYALEDVRARMNGVVVGAAVREYQRLCRGVPAVCFCVDIKHSQAVAEAFRAAGIRAEHLDGDTPKGERRGAIAGLSGGSVDVITNCGLISEGLDVSGIGAAILLRPTASLALYLQQVGRALRPAPGKERAVILDFAGNCARHGLPDERRQWSLDSMPRCERERAEGPRLRRCAACGALNAAKAHVCAECGSDLRTPKERQEIELRLRVAKQRELEDMVARMRPFERRLWAGADERRLRLVARVSGYRPGWIFYAKQEAERRIAEGRRA